MYEILVGAIKDAVSELGLPEVDFTLEHPKELSHGDWASNIALVAFEGRRAFEKAIDGNSETVNVKYGVENTNPIKLAQAIVEQLQKQAIAGVAEILVAGPGFINFTLNRNIFIDEIKNIQTLKDTWGQTNILAGKKIMVEYTDPNPFKPFHIGHLMTNAIGESIARLLEASGAKVVRANYQGDVGLHVAKAIWGLQSETFPEGLKDEKNITVLAQYIGYCYVNGAKKYDEDEKVKKEIDVINKKIYEKSDTKINELYDWGRSVTLEAFEIIYQTLGTKFDYYFFESEMAKKGKLLVEEWLAKGVFEESEGAVVFKAEKYDPKLHTRVFITKNDLPTYETKEIGLTVTKFEKENLDESIVITANEQKDYMAVATEAIRQIYPEYAVKMHHLVHGMMRFATGKMSSRTGNVITGESLLRDTIVSVKQKMVENHTDHVPQIVAVSAIKFAILRQAIGGNIVYDQDKAISFEGDSGPYLQYVTVRAGSLLTKGAEANIMPDLSVPVAGTETLERIVVRFPEIVSRSISEWAPHHLVGYLIDLAQYFNSWYGQGKVIDENKEATAYRLAIVDATKQTITNGLKILGISVPEKM